MIQKFTAIAVCALLALPAWSQNQFETPITAEVVPGWIKADGARVAALRLSLAPGWKTYWRAPGDAGIPPRFDWSRSRNLNAVSVVWPTPEVFDQNGMRSVGYQDTLIIPLQINPGATDKPVRLRARMELGICADICIPHELTFDAELSSDSLTPTPAIVAALSQTPYSASEAGVTSATCRISPTSDGLMIETALTMPSAGGPEYVVMEPGAGEIWVSEAKTKRKGGTLTATSELVHVNGGAIALDRSAIRITVLGSKHAVDIRGCTPG